VSVNALLWTETEVRNEEVVAILISPYYRPWNGEWEEIMNGWSATPSKIISSGVGSASFMLELRLQE
jgi:hypothetical protein